MKLHRWMAASLAAWALAAPAAELPWRPSIQQTARSEIASVDLPDISMGPPGQASPPDLLGTNLADAQGDPLPVQPRPEAHVQIAAPEPGPAGLAGATLLMLIAASLRGRR